MTAEQILSEHLKSHLSVPVSLTHRSEESGSFVILERLGGKVADGLERASFAIQSYGDTMLEACQLNSEVRRAMNILYENDSITSVSLDSDYNFTDKKTKHYRYQGIYDLVLFYEEEK